MKRKIIAVSEARKRFAEIEDEMLRGDTMYVVVRYGKEVLRISPPSNQEEVDPNLESDIAEFFDEYGDVLTELAKR